MTITYHAGRRIQGTSTDATAVSGGWKEIGRTTLGSDGDTIDITSLDNKRYYMVLQNILGNGIEISPEITFNGDTGTNYPIRRSNNGGSDWTSTTYNYMYNAYGGTNSDRFIVGYIANQSNKEKLYQHHQCINVNRSDAGTAPDRNELASKWANTSNAINRITVTNSSSGDFIAGSEVVVLGWDPADTHTSNFWEELASVDLSGGVSDTLDSGTITAKKYLWVQFYVKSVTGVTRPTLRFNSDTGSNYANRESLNGATDATNTSMTRDYITSSDIPVGTGYLGNMFIVNNAANEKLVIQHGVYGNTAGAGTAPIRVESVAKWTNTSVQATSIQIINDRASADFNTVSTMKVWGSN